ncbi:uncharacterized protein N7479_009259 [Penicillium vulpinum]|uniref:Uncharacterized protein n=1 Tax=Penicillium vulpinum TaxID=29845 RepID=A0A1V6RVW6_9EURO|nr:uncharacterized protein N7479_009259 [Penicillium vulpinum]KAJ5950846.1 hypothetical protein N7479_009259 [Penicillium vulpinum]OQE05917.1 hypothetical protein PENVUL_c021G03240 [Penicillium vulpinum]
MPAPEPPKSVVEFLHEVFFGPQLEGQDITSSFLFGLLVLLQHDNDYCRNRPGLGFQLGPRPPARPVPECSNIVVVADIPPVPPIRPPDAVRNEPQASASTSTRLRHRLRRINELPAITLGHSVTCGCEDCRNRRFNRMTPMEEGWPEL